MDKLKTPIALITVAVLAHLGIYLIAAPEHVVDPAWPAHARFHVLQAIFWMAGGNLLLLAILHRGLRDGGRWALGALLCGWLFLQLSYFVGLLAVPGGGPPETYAHLGLAVPLLLYAAGLGMAWRRMPRATEGRRRRLWPVLALAVAAVIAVVAVRTARLESRQIQVEPVPAPALDVDAAAGRLAQALRYRTISHQDPAQNSGPEFLGLHAHLQASFPRVHQTLGRETVSEYSLLYTWKGSDESLAPIVLASHLDVVPVDPATESRWTYPPFEGRVANGYVWGRGAWDDKIGVLSLLEAVELLLAEGFQPKRTVLLAFGHDEEASGTMGAAKLAALLERRGVKAELVLDEGMVIGEGLVPGVAAPVALVGVSEKGYVNAELIAGSQGGHSSAPPRQTAIGILALAVQRLEQNPVPGGIAGLPERTFEFLAPEMPLLERMLFANLWLFRPLIESQMSARPSSDSILRTTTAVTIVEGGVKENVLPTQARALVNFRIRPGDSVESVLQHVRRTVADERVQVRQAAGQATEPSPESSVEAPAFRLMSRTLRQVLPGVVVAPSLVTGATDGRYYTGVSRNVYRFLPVRVGPEDVPRFHGTDERVAVRDVALAIAFYRQLIRNSDELR